jgi:hypothetical protein
MATHDWMKGEHSADGPAERRAPAARKERRSPLEIALALTGVAAWVWCAYVVLTTLKW